MMKNLFHVVLRPRWRYRLWAWIQRHILRRKMRFKSVEILNPTTGLRLMDLDEPTFIGEPTIPWEIKHIPKIESTPNEKPNPYHDKGGFCGGGGCVR